jgi:hypothetical protein
MKKILLSIISVLCSLTTVGQDVIVLQNGDEIECKLVEVGVENIKYKRLSNLNGPTFVEEKDDVFMIKYQNGEKDVFGVKTEFQSQDILINPSSVMTVPSLIYDKDSKSGLSSGGTELSIKYAQRIMRADWNDFQMYQAKREKGKKLIVWSAVCRVLSSGTVVVGIFTGDIPWYIVASGLRLTSYPLLATGLVNTIKGIRGCKRLVKQHNASSLSFNPEFDFGLGMNAVSFYMNF